MCTVTYIPTKEGFYLTSNRDEHHIRGVAIAPAIHNGLLYPKDPDKNGSWIAAKANGDIAVLLNGAFIKHNRKPPYRISRGSVVLDVLAAAQSADYFKGVELNDVEPFTLIICTNGKLTECRWDGSEKHILPLDRDTPPIWSSATLYDESAQAEKASRFNNWLNCVTKKDSHSIIDFHRTERLDGDISTVSVTLVEARGGLTTMTYDDLKAGTRKVQQLTRPVKNIPWLSLRIFLIRLFNWEYWPYQLVYIPVMFYWFWLSIKSRSLFFFNTANPGMKNGGFAMESKNDIYVLLPPQYYPKTQLIKAGSATGIIGMPLPLIAKPDIGQRGLQVKLLKSTADLADYVQNSKVDFLLQEYVDLPKEAGIFYCRMPGNITGAITGIVGKELMRVTGDGRSTLQELMAKDPRYLLQIPVLEDGLLQTIIPPGEVYYPAPYGNHSRGAKFIDMNRLVTFELVQSIDAVCSKIPGFYYGRLDIKYHTWAELCGGKFKIIEVNGAASEPAHMYDPIHSIFFAWREIIRHWAILYQISKQNRRDSGLTYLTYREGMDMIKSNTQYVNLTNA